MGGRELSKTLGLVGSGVGIIAFLAFGLMRGVLIGGTAGLQLGCCILGDGSAGADMLPRLLAGLGMVVGAALSGVIFISSGLVVGRVTGYVIGEDAAKKVAELPKAVH